MVLPMMNLHRLRWHRNCPNSHLPLLLLLLLIASLLIGIRSEQTGTTTSSSTSTSNDLLSPKLRVFRSTLDTILEQHSTRLEQLHSTMILQLQEMESEVHNMQQQLSTRLQEIEGLTEDKTFLAHQLSACHSRWNESLAIKQEVSETFHTSLELMSSYLNLQLHDLHRMHTEFNDMKSQLASAAGSGSNSESTTDSTPPEPTPATSSTPLAEILHASMVHQMELVKSAADQLHEDLQKDQTEQAASRQNAIEKATSSGGGSSSSSQGNDHQRLINAFLSSATDTDSSTTGSEPIVFTVVSDSKLPRATTLSSGLTLSAPVMELLQRLSGIQQVAAAANGVQIPVTDTPPSSDQPPQSVPPSIIDLQPPPPAIPTIQFHPDQPLHKQPAELRSRNNRSTYQHTPFPGDFSTNGKFSELNRLQSADIQSKQSAIRDEFWHAWLGYRTHAYGYDELHPISRQGKNSQYYMALTMIDALDTMIIMGFEQEYEHIRDYLAEYLIFTEQEDINVFETTIRVIGGLLSAHALTSDPMFLMKAEECARGLLIAFQTPTGLPLGTVGLKSRIASNPAWAQGSSTMAEIGSIQLEWQYLSRVTGDRIFEEKVDHVMQRLSQMKSSLYPQFINVDNGQFTSATITFGARVDSIYEYFLKQSILSGGRKEKALEMYINSMLALDRDLIQEARPLNPGEDPLVYIAEKHGDVINGKMDHLVCFVPGMLALGVESKSVSPTHADRHMYLARKLMRTCYEMYQFTPTGLAPEIVQFSLNVNSPDIGMKVDPNAAHNLLRPETVESLFIMYRVTHDPLYREWGWKIFESIKKYCRIEGAGYSGLKDVRQAGRPDGTENWWNWNDKMESFFLSETLKYLYLLFSPDELLPLNEWVFNTEAHPLPIDRHQPAINQSDEATHDQPPTPDTATREPRTTSDPPVAV